MIAQYLDDIPLYLGRMLGRGGSGPKTPSGYDLFFNKDTGATRYGVFGKMAAKEAELRAAKTGGFYGRKGYGIMSRPMRGISSGVEHFKSGFGSSLGIAGIVGTGLLESYSAPRGHHVTRGVKGLLSASAFIVGDAIGTALGGGNIVAGFAVGTMFEKAGSALGGGLDRFSDFNRSIKHVNMGGNYEDTRAAYTMRQRAAQEMGSSVMNARSWLGKESVLMHQ